MGQRMRIANGHEHVAGTRLDLIEREVGRAQQVERARFLEDVRGLSVPCAEREPRRESHDKSHCRDRRAIAGRHHCQCTSRDNDCRSEKSQRHLATPQAQVPRRLEWHVVRTQSSQPNERGHREDDGSRDADGIRVSQPRHAASAREHDEDHRGGGEVDGPRWSAEASVEGREATRQCLFHGRPMKNPLGIGQGCVRRRTQHEASRAGERD